MTFEELYARARVTELEWESDAHRNRMEFHRLAAAERAEAAARERTRLTLARLRRSAS